MNETNFDNQIQTAYGPPPFEDSTPPAKKKFSFLGIGIMILILLIIGALGYFFRSNIKSEYNKLTGNPVSTTNTATTTTTNSAATATTAVTADWKTYSNTTYTYSIKYPANYYTLNSDNSKAVAADTANVVIYSPDDGIAPGQEMAGPQDSGGLFISSALNPKNLSLEAFATQSEASGTQNDHLVFQHQTVLINGQSAIESIPTAASVVACGGLGCGNMTIYLQQAGRVFTFAFGGDANSIKDSTSGAYIYNEIVGTFQFTSSTTTVSVNTSIESIDFSKIISIDTALDDRLLAPTYADLNADNSEEALVVRSIGGTGGIVNFYIYGMKNGSSTQLFKKEGLYRGNVSISNKVVNADYANTDSTINSGKANVDIVVDTHKKYTWNGTTFVESNQ
ncbi:MAG: hypothetical protein NTW50_01910 [Candidatus Berkelbacteria bacterium]|nr:hypothetical protein [Candidatus Berkelbacteria bacterium]